MCHDCNPLETNTGLVTYSGPNLTLCTGKTITNGESMTSVIEKIQYCIDLINQEIDITGLVESSDCITLLGTSIKDVLQSILDTESAFCNQLADLQTEIDLIWNTINGGSTVKNVNITSCNPTFDISLVETPTQKTFKLGAFVPKNTILPYFGDITDFDSNGLGLASAGLLGWAIANGNTHNINGVNITTIDACGRYLKYDCNGCCTTGGSNTITLEEANIPEIPFNVDADFTLSGETNESGKHNHNIGMSVDDGIDPYYPAMIAIDGKDCGGETRIIGPNTIYPEDSAVVCNATSVDDNFSPVLYGGLHSHTFDATATGSFSATVGNPIPTPITIEPEYIAGIPIQFIGC
jgi:hypothetical protein